jgi:hypothetical protein
VSERDADDLPETLTIDEAFRAAFYMILAYLELEERPRDALVLYAAVHVDRSGAVG